MAQFYNIFKVELNTGACPVVSLRQIHYADKLANRVGVEAYFNGLPQTLAGTCSGTAILSDGSTVAISGGQVSGNTAYIELPAGCYSVEGQIRVFVKLTTGGVTTTLLAAVGTVMLTETDTVIDPGTIIPSVSQLISDIEDAVASIPSDYSNLITSIAPNFSSSATYHTGDYVWYSGTLYRFTQDHSGTWNSSHASAATVSEGLNTGVVKYDGAQSLTGAQKAQARENIAAAYISDADSGLDSSGFFIEY